jgi:hypothetical protein
MTKKDFIAIAALVYCLDPHVVDDDIKRHIAFYFADFLATQNPNFDRQRFVLACLEGKISARKGCTPR